MDVRMPGVDGIEGTRRITATGSPTRVLILTTFDNDEYAFAALRAGASGFLLEDAPPEELLAGIRAVASRDGVAAPRTMRRLLDAFAQHLPVDGGEPSGTRLEALTPPASRRSRRASSRSYARSQTASPPARSPRAW